MITLMRLLGYGEIWFLHIATEIASRAHSPPTRRGKGSNAKGLEFPWVFDSSRGLHGKNT
eukprot:9472640-Pyramimonas_sp.AAC.1